MISIRSTFIKRVNKKNQLYVRLDSGQVVHLSEILKWFPEKASEIENTFYKGDIEQLTKQLSEIFSELLPH